MSLFKWEFECGWYALYGVPDTCATITPQRPLVQGRRVDKWRLHMSFYIEQTGRIEELREHYSTQEKAKQAAEEHILRYKLEGKI